MGTCTLSQSTSGADSVNLLGIIAALPAEAHCLVARLDSKHTDVTTPQLIADNVELIISGVGSQQAELAANTLINHGANALLSWGCAGALSAHLQPGDLLLPRLIKSEACATTFTIDTAWHTRLEYRLAHAGAHTGALAESGRMLVNQQQKQRLHQSSAAIAVDMESATIAACAQAAGIPFMVIRSIVDDVESSIPAYISHAVDSRGTIRPASLFALLIRHPSSWRELIRLGRQFHAAKSTLKFVARAAGTDFLAFADHSAP